MPKNLVRSNPVHQEYTQAMADLISIFWKVHIDRVDQKNIPFACDIREENGVDRFVEFEFKNTSDPIQGFSEGVRNSMRGSWIDFINMQRIPPGYLPRSGHGIPVPTTTQQSSDIYVYNLFHEVLTLQKKAKGKHEKDLSTEVIMSQGIGTGAEMVTFLKAVQQEKFTPSQARRISRTRRNKLDELKTAIGIPFTIPAEKNVNNPSAETKIKPDFLLISAAEGGLDTKKLLAMRLTDGIGCPANLPPSESAQQFLASRGVSIDGTMLQEFAQRMSLEYDNQVQHVYEGLTRRERQKAVTPEAAYILSGHAREQAVRRDAEKPSTRER